MSVRDIIQAAAGQGEYYNYLLIDPRTQLPFYVGKGRGSRCLSHIREARRTNKNSPKLSKIRKIESLGLSVQIKKINQNVTDDLAKEFECFLISELRDFGIELTNKTDGGEGSVGYKHTPESLQKIGKAQLGVPKPDSQKQKLSQYLKANPIHDRPNVKEKVSGVNHWAYGKTPYNKGVPLTDEHRQKISKSLSGENHPFYGEPCSEERRLAIVASTTGVKKSTTVNMRKPKAKVQCPHCQKMMSGGNLARWHGDNCKEKLQ